MKIFGDILRERSPVAILIGIALVAAIGWFIYQTMEIWGYFLISVAIAYLLSGSVNKLSDRGVPRTMAVFISFVGLLAGLSLILLILIPMLRDQINRFADDFPRFVTQTQHHFDHFNSMLHDSNLPEEIKNMPDRFWGGFEEFGVRVLQRSVNGVIGIFSRLYAFIIIPLATYYLLKDVHKFNDVFLNLFSPENRGNVQDLLSELDTAFGGFIRSRLKLCLIVGTGMIAGLYIFKIPYPVVLGLIAGICEFVPYVGPIVGAVPTLLVGFISHKFLVAIIIVAIVQLLENAVFVPKVMGSEMGLHPLVVLLALLAGGQLAGAGGMIISVPLVAAGKILIQYFLEYRAKQHELAIAAAPVEPVNAGPGTEGNIDTEVGRD